MAGILGNLFPQGFMPHLRNNSNTYLQTGLGLLSGRTGPEQFAMGAQGFGSARQQAQEKAKLNKTIEYLKTVNPELGRAAEMGMIAPGDAFKIDYEQKMDAQKAQKPTPYTDLAKARSDLNAGLISQDQFNQIVSGGGEGAARWSTQPELFRDTEGNYRYGTFSASGEFKPIDTGGLTPVNPYESAFERARGTAGGKAMGEGANTAPQDISNSLKTAQQIDELLKTPGFDQIYGRMDQFRPGWAMGSSGRDALARYKQLQGKAFLEAYSMLKGGGQITEVEGQKAEAAMVRLDRAQDETTARQALMDFKDAIIEGARKLKDRYGVDANIPSTAEDPLGIRN